MGNLGLSGGVWTALRMNQLIGLRHDSVRALLAEVDHCVALCQWVKDLLLNIGVPEHKVTISRQGLCHSVHNGTFNQEVPRYGARARIAFLGRLDPVKGIHILVRALRTIPSADLGLDIFGVTQGPRDEEYAFKLKSEAAGDPRIRFQAPMSSVQVIPTLCTYDAVAIPSQSMETGPMVVLEAFAAGVPVIGSRLGGIEEQVRHDIDGLLIEPGSLAAWTEVFRCVSSDPDLLTRLRSGVRPPRTMTTAASEIEAVYAVVNKGLRSFLPVGS
jgi:glycosyltransferase involved in cell wall biosynthesis